MKRSSIVQAGIVALAVMFALAAKPRGATGQVVDAQGSPIPGADVCTVLPGGAPGLCAHSSDDGTYNLPANGAGDVRIVVRGYLPRTVPAVAQDKPIVLEQAAALRVRIQERGSGKELPSAQVDVVYSTGRKLGSFPANPSGLSLPTLPAGDARVVVRSAGHKEATSDVLHLEGGKKVDTLVELEPAAADGAPGK